MKYYAANNDYATDTRIGFNNTWFALAFAGKKARDQYVATAPGMAVRAITRREVTKYVARTPVPFSSERYALIMPARDDIPGLLGVIEVAPSRDAAYYLEDL